MYKKAGHVCLQIPLHHIDIIMVEVPYMCACG